MNASVALRPAGPGDATAIHRLICENLEVGHLLPRSLDDVERHVERFFVAESDGRVVGCAELAPLSGAVAEVRSLVVEQAFRGRQIGPGLVHHVAAAAGARSFSTLCAFTHEPSHFVRMGFTIVPHVWVPEKIAHDCTGCTLFRHCGQYAVTLPLREGVHLRPEQPAAVIHSPGRTIAPRRPNIERLHLRSVQTAQEESVPA
ncbi:MAG TPA: GNAT family N-acetyltransferase [Vicinamibacterales bacterium]|nr:GNAT family N-acetyltransferase [Vicinamibacterales bacterium]